MGGLASIVLFCTKAFWDYVRGRNNKLNEAIKRINHLESGQILLKRDIASVKNHGYRNHEEMKEILNKIDKKLPNDIWDEITK